jgi:hypothetical protein
VLPQGLIFGSVAGAMSTLMMSMRGDTAAVEENLRK